MTASLSVNHSSVKYKASGVVIKTMGGLPDCPPAVKLKTEDNDKITIITCTYKPFTKAIALISLILSQLLLIIFCCKPKNKVKSMKVVIFAVTHLTFLFFGGILMISDIINGKKQLSDMPNYSYQPFEFIMNVLFVFLGMICEGLATYFALTNKPPRHPYQPIHHENTPISVNKPYRNQGEPSFQENIPNYEQDSPAVCSP